MKNLKTTKPVNIAIVDDHDIYRVGVKRFLEKYKSLINIVGEFRDGSELINSNSLAKIDLVLTDVFMPIVGGVELTKLLQKNYPHIKVIILSMSNCETTIEETIKLGASSYLLKCESPEKLLETILSTYLENLP